MTAVVGILNKQAIALAADSAITIGGANGRKIFNKANKVFTLSKRQPVGIMIYNSASFMGTPWETIIKIYRKKLFQESFNTLAEYQKDFINFLESKSFYSDESTQKIYLESFALDIINFCSNQTAEENRSLISHPTPENKEQFLALLEGKFEEVIQQWGQPTITICGSFSGYTFEMFEQYASPVFDKIRQNRFLANGLAISQQLLDKIKNSVFLILRATEDFSSHTGLVFCGFGEEEIYPQLISVNISIAIDNRLRFYVNEKQNASISNGNNGAVRAFAQRDVIDTILTGIDPSLDDIYLRNFDTFFKKYNQAILDSIGDTNPLLSEQIRNLDSTAIVDEIMKSNQQIKSEQYIKPLMNAVSNLGKEDLAEMAESLIYLTYLKRRITFSEESVGGPVDVAIISKGDGFVWIKRKHYFRPDLNQHFFSNYFNK